MPVQRPKSPEPVLGRHMKDAPDVFPGILAIVRPPTVVVDGRRQQVDLPSELSDHRLDATVRNLQTGREGGPPQQYQPEA